MSILPILGLLLSGVGTVGGTVAQNKATRAQREQQELNVRRQRRSAIRAAQIARASSLASAGAVGALPGSGAQGGIGSLTSRVGSDLGFGTQMSGLSGIVTTQTQRANLFGTVASVGGALYRAGGSPSFNELFPRNEENS